MREVYEWVRDIVIALIIAGTILMFFKPIVVKQDSMQPTFYSNDYIVVSKQAYNVFGDVERGDVIVFKSNLLNEKGEQKHLIKRVIGIGGDKIEIKEGYVYLNGSKLDEAYVAKQGLSGEMDAITVEEGKLFVMGDNRGVSQDSRSPEVGQVDEETIVGKVVLRIFPFDSIEKF